MGLGGGVGWGVGEGAGYVFCYGEGGVGWEEGGVGGGEERGEVGGEGGWGVFAVEPAQGAEAGGAGGGFYAEEFWGGVAGAEEEVVRVSFYQFFRLRGGGLFRHQFCRF